MQPLAHDICPIGLDPTRRCTAEDVVERIISCDVGPVAATIFECSDCLELRTAVSSGVRDILEAITTAARRSRILWIFLALTSPEPALSFNHALAAQSGLWRHVLEIMTDRTSATNDVRVAICLTGEMLRAIKNLEDAPESHRPLVMSCERILFGFAGTTGIPRALFTASVSALSQRYDHLYVDIARGSNIQRDLDTLLRLVDPAVLDHAVFDGAVVISRLSKLDTTATSMKGSSILATMCSGLASIGNYLPSAYSTPRKAYMARYILGCMHTLFLKEEHAQDTNILQVVVVLLRMLTEPVTTDNFSFHGALTEKEDREMYTSRSLAFGHAIAIIADVRAEPASLAFLVNHGIFDLLIKALVYCVEHVAVDGTYTRALDVPFALIHVMRLFHVVSHDFHTNFVTTSEFPTLLLLFDRAPRAVTVELLRLVDLAMDFDSEDTSYLKLVAMPLIMCMASMGRSIVKFEHPSARELLILELVLLITRAQMRFSQNMPLIFEKFLSDEPCIVRCSLESAAFPQSLKLAAAEIANELLLNETYIRELVSRVPQNLLWPMKFQSEYRLVLERDMRIVNQLIIEEDATRCKIESWCDAVFTQLRTLHRASHTTVQRDELVDFGSQVLGLMLELSVERVDVYHALTYEAAAKESACARESRNIDTRWWFEANKLQNDHMHQEMDPLGESDTRAAKMKRQQDETDLLIEKVEASKALRVVEEDIEKKDVEEFLYQRAIQDQRIGHNLEGVELQLKYVEGTVDVLQAQEDDIDYIFRLWIPIRISIMHDLSVKCMAETLREEFVSERRSFMTSFMQRNLNEIQHCSLMSDTPQVAVQSSLEEMELYGDVGNMIVWIEDGIEGSGEILVVDNDFDLTATTDQNNNKSGESDYHSRKLTRIKRDIVTTQRKERSSRHSIIQCQHYMFSALVSYLASSAVQLTEVIEITERARLQSEMSVDFERMHAMPCWVWFNDFLTTADAVRDEMQRLPQSDLTERTLSTMFAITRCFEMYMSVATSTIWMPLYDVVTHIKQLNALELDRITVKLRLKDCRTAVMDMQRKLATQMEYITALMLTQVDCLGNTERTSYWSQHISGHCQTFLDAQVDIRKQTTSHVAASQEAFGVDYAVLKVQWDLREAFVESCASFKNVNTFSDALETAHLIRCENSVRLEKVSETAVSAQHHILSLLRNNESSRAVTSAIEKYVNSVTTLLLPMLRRTSISNFPIPPSLGGIEAMEAYTRVIFRLQEHELRAPLSVAYFDVLIENNIATEQHQRSCLAESEEVAWLHMMRLETIEVYDLECGAESCFIGDSFDNQLVEADEVLHQMQDDVFHGVFSVHISDLTTAYDESIEKYKVLMKREYDELRRVRLVSIINDLKGLKERDLRRVGLLQHEVAYVVQCDRSDIKNRLYESIEGTYSNALARNNAIHALHTSYTRTQSALDTIDIELNFRLQRQTTLTGTASQIRQTITTMLMIYQRQEQLWSAQYGQSDLLLELRQQYTDAAVLRQKREKVDAFRNESIREEIVVTRRDLRMTKSATLERGIKQLRHLGFVGDEWPHREDVLIAGSIEDALSRLLGHARSTTRSCFDAAHGIVDSLSAWRTTLRERFDEYRDLVGQCGTKDSAIQRVFVSDAYYQAMVHILDANEVHMQDLFEALYSAEPENRLRLGHNIPTTEKSAHNEVMESVDRLEIQLEQQRVFSDFVSSFVTDVLGAMERQERSKRHELRSDEVAERAEIVNECISNRYSVILSVKAARDVRGGDNNTDAIMTDVLVVRELVHRSSTEVLSYIHNQIEGDPRTAKQWQEMKSEFIQLIARLQVHVDEGHIEAVRAGLMLQVKDFATALRSSHLKDVLRATTKKQKDRYRHAAHVREVAARYYAESLEEMRDLRDVVEEHTYIREDIDDVSRRSTLREQAREYALIRHDMDSQPPPEFPAMHVSPDYFDALTKVNTLNVLSGIEDYVLERADVGVLARKRLALIHRYSGILIGWKPQFPTLKTEARLNEALIKFRNVGGNLETEWEDSSRAVVRSSATRLEKITRSLEEMPFPERRAEVQLEENFVRFSIEDAWYTLLASFRRASLTALLHLCQYESRVATRRILAEEYHAFEWIREKRNRLTSYATLQEQRHVAFDEFDRHVESMDAFVAKIESQADDIQTNMTFYLETKRLDPETQANLLMCASVVEHQIRQQLHDYAEAVRFYHRTRIALIETKMNDIMRSVTHLNNVEAATIERAVESDVHQLQKLLFPYVRTMILSVNDLGALTDLDTNFVISGLPLELTQEEEHALFDMHNTSRCVRESQRSPPFMADPFGLSSDAFLSCIPPQGEALDPTEGLAVRALNKDIDFHRTRVELIDGRVHQFLAGSRSHFQSVELSSARDLEFMLTELAFSMDLDRYASDTTDVHTNSASVEEFETVMRTRLMLEFADQTTALIRPHFNLLEQRLFMLYDDMRLDIMTTERQCRIGVSMERNKERDIINDQLVRQSSEKRAEWQQLAASLNLNALSDQWSNEPLMSSAHELSKEMAVAAESEFLLVLHFFDDWFVYQCCLQHYERQALRSMTRRLVDEEAVAWAKAAQNSRELQRARVDMERQKAALVAWRQHAEHSMYNVHVMRLMSKKNKADKDSELRRQVRERQGMQKEYEVQTRRIEKEYDDIVLKVFPDGPEKGNQQQETNMRSSLTGTWQELKDRIRNVTPQASSEQAASTRVLQFLEDKAKTTKHVMTIHESAADTVYDTLEEWLGRVSNLREKISNSWSGTAESHSELIISLVDKTRRLFLNTLRTAANEIVKAESQETDEESYRRYATLSHVETWEECYRHILLFEWSHGIANVQRLRADDDMALLEAMEGVERASTVEQEAVEFGWIEQDKQLDRAGSELSAHTTDLTAQHVAQREYNNVQRRKVCYHLHKGEQQLRQHIESFRRAYGEYRDQNIHTAPEDFERAQACFDDEHKRVGGIMSDFRRCAELLWSYVIHIDGMVSHEQIVMEEMTIERVMSTLKESDSMQATCRKRRLDIVTTHSQHSRHIAEVTTLMTRQHTRTNTRQWVTFSVRSRHTGSMDALLQEYTKYIKSRMGGVQKQLEEIKECSEELNGTSAEEVEGLAMALRSFESACVHTLASSTGHSAKDLAANGVGSIVQFVHYVLNHTIGVPADLSLKYAPMRRLMIQRVNLCRRMSAQFTCDVCWDSAIASKEWHALHQKRVVIYNSMNDKLRGFTDGFVKDLEPTVAGYVRACGLSVKSLKDVQSEQETRRRILLREFTESHSELVAGITRIRLVAVENNEVEDRWQLEVEYLDATGDLSTCMADAQSLLQRKAMIRATEREVSMLRSRVLEVEFALGLDASVSLRGPWMRRLGNVERQMCKNLFEHFASYEWTNFIRPVTSKLPPLREISPQFVRGVGRQLVHHELDQHTVAMFIGFGTTFSADSLPHALQKYIGEVFTLPSVDYSEAGRRTSHYDLVPPRSAFTSEAVDGMGVLVQRRLTVVVRVDRDYERLLRKHVDAYMNHESEWAFKLQTGLFDDMRFVIEKRRKDLDIMHREQQAVECDARRKGSESLRHFDTVVARQRLDPAEEFDYLAIVETWERRVHEASAITFYDRLMNELFDCLRSVLVEREDTARERLQSSEASLFNVLGVEFHVGTIATVARSEESAARKNQQYDTEHMLREQTRFMDVMANHHNRLKKVLELRNAIPEKTSEREKVRLRAQLQQEIESLEFSYHRDTVQTQGEWKLLMSELSTDTTEQLSLMASRTTILKNISDATGTFVRRESAYLTEYSEAFLQTRFNHVTKQAVLEAQRRRTEGMTFDDVEPNASQDTMLANKSMSFVGMTNLTRLLKEETIKYDLKQYSQKQALEDVAVRERRKFLSDVQTQMRMGLPEIGDVDVTRSYAYAVLQDILTNLSTANFHERGQQKLNLRVQHSKRKRLIVVQHMANLSALENEWVFRIEEAQESGRGSEVGALLKQMRQELQEARSVQMIELQGLDDSLHHAIKNLQSKYVLASTAEEVVMDLVHEERDDRSMILLEHEDTLVSAVSRFFTNLTACLVAEHDGIVRDMHLEEELDFEVLSTEFSSNLPIARCDTDIRYALLLEGLNNDGEQRLVASVRADVAGLKQSIEAEITGLFSAARSPTKTPTRDEGVMRDVESEHLEEVKSTFNEYLDQFTTDNVHSSDAQAMHHMWKLSVKLHAKDLARRRAQHETGYVRSVADAKRNRCRKMREATNEHRHRIARIEAAHMLNQITLEHEHKARFGMLQVASSHREEAIRQVGERNTMLTSHRMRINDELRDFGNVVSGIEDEFEAEMEVAKARSDKAMVCLPTAETMSIVHQGAQLATQQFEKQAGVLTEAVQSAHRLMLEQAHLMHERLRDLRESAEPYAYIESRPTLVLRSKITDALAEFREKTSNVYLRMVSGHAKELAYWYRQLSRPFGFSVMEEMESLERIFIIEQHNVFFRELFGIYFEWTIGNFNFQEVSGRMAIGSEENVEYINLESAERLGYADALEREERRLRDATRRASFIRKLEDDSEWMYNLDTLENHKLQTNALKSFQARRTAAITRSQAHIRSMELRLDVSLAMRRDMMDKQEQFEKLDLDINLRSQTLKMEEKHKERHRATHNPTNRLDELDLQARERWLLRQRFDQHSADLEDSYSESRKVMMTTHAAEVATMKARVAKRYEEIDTSAASLKLDSEIADVTARRQTLRESRATQLQKLRTEYRSACNAISLKQGALAFREARTNDHSTSPTDNGIEPSLSSPIHSQSKVITVEHKKQLRAAHVRYLQQRFSTEADFDRRERELEVTMAMEYTPMVMQMELQGLEEVARFTIVHSYEELIDYLNDAQTTFLTQQLEGTEETQRRMIYEEAEEYFARLLCDFIEAYGTISRWEAEKNIYELVGKSNIDATELYRDHRTMARHTFEKEMNRVQILRNITLSELWTSLSKNRDPVLMRIAAAFSYALGVGHALRVMFQHECRYRRHELMSDMCVQFAVPKVVVPEILQTVRKGAAERFGWWESRLKAENVHSQGLKVFTVVSQSCLHILNIWQQEDLASCKSVKEYEDLLDTYSDESKNLKAFFERKVHQATTSHQKTLLELEKELRGLHEEAEVNISELVEKVSIRNVAKPYDPYQLCQALRQAFATPRPTPFSPKMDTYMSNLEQLLRIERTTQSDVDNITPESDFMIEMERVMKHRKDALEVVSDAITYVMPSSMVNLASPDGEAVSLEDWEELSRNIVVQDAHEDLSELVFEMFANLRTVLMMQQTSCREDTMRRETIDREELTVAYLSGMWEAHNQMQRRVNADNSVDSAHADLERAVAAARQRFGAQRHMMDKHFDGILSILDNKADLDRMRIECTREEHTRSSYGGLEAEFAESEFRIASEQLQTDVTQATERLHTQRNRESRQVESDLNVFLAVLEYSAVYEAREARKRRAEYEATQESLRHQTGLVLSKIPTITEEELEWLRDDSSELLKLEVRWSLKTLQEANDKFINIFRVGSEFRDVLEAAQGRIVDERASENPAMERGRSMGMFIARFTDIFGVLDYEILLEKTLVKEMHEAKAAKELHKHKAKWAKDMSETGIIFEGVPKSLVSVEALRIFCGEGSSYTAATRAQKVSTDLLHFFQRQRLKIQNLQREQNHAFLTVETACNAEIAQLNETQYQEFLHLDACEDAASMLRNHFYQRNETQRKYHQLLEQTRVAQLQAVQALDRKLQDEAWAFEKAALATLPLDELIIIFVQNESVTAKQLKLEEVEDYDKIMTRALMFHTETLSDEEVPDRNVIVQCAAVAFEAITRLCTIEGRFMEVHAATQAIQRHKEEESARQAEQIESNMLKLSRLQTDLLESLDGDQRYSMEEEFASYIDFEDERQRAALRQFEAAENSRYILKKMMLDEAGTILAAAQDYLEKFRRIKIMYVTELERLRGRRTHTERMHNYKLQFALEEFDKQTDRLIAQSVVASEKGEEFKRRARDRSQLMDDCMNAIAAEMDCSMEAERQIHSKFHEDEAKLCEDITQTVTGGLPSEPTMYASLLTGLVDTLEGRTKSDVVSLRNDMLHMQALQLKRRQEKDKKFHEQNAHISALLQSFALLAENMDTEHETSIRVMEHSGASDEELARAREHYAEKRSGVARSQAENLLRILTAQREERPRKAKVATTQQSGSRPSSRSRLPSSSSGLALFDDESDEELMESLTPRSKMAAVRVKEQGTRDAINNEQNYIRVSMFTSLFETWRNDILHYEEAKREETLELEDARFMAIVDKAEMLREGERLPSIAAGFLPRQSSLSSSGMLSRRGTLLSGHSGGGVGGGKRRIIPRRRFPIIEAYAEQTRRSAADDAYIIRVRNILLDEHLQRNAQERCEKESWEVVWGSFTTERDQLRAWIRRRLTMFWQVVGMQFLPTPSDQAQVRTVLMQKDAEAVVWVENGGTFEELLAPAPPEITSKMPTKKWKDVLAARAAGVEDRPALNMEELRAAAEAEDRRLIEEQHRMFNTPVGVRAERLDDNDATPNKTRKVRTNIVSSSPSHEHRGTLARSRRDLLVNSPSTAWGTPSRTTRKLGEDEDTFVEEGAPSTQLPSGAVMEAMGGSEGRVLNLRRPNASRSASKNNSTTPKRSDHPQNDSDNSRKKAMTPTVERRESI